MKRKRKPYRARMYAMKRRPRGFLAPEKIDWHSEAFDYIVELHNILWRFVRAALPDASGSLSDHIPRALAVVEVREIKPRRRKK